MKNVIDFLQKSLGIEQPTVSHAERIVSALGGFVAILCIVYTGERLLGEAMPVLLVASMGASAVLLFAVPHGQLSQPWPVLGGHLVSAVIGVTCANWIGSDMLAGSAAVGIAIGVMYYLKCIHPPGGATALSAVTGGEAVHALGYGYVLTPVLFDVAVILSVAILFNLLFQWRRYPNYLHLRRQEAKVAAAPPRSTISHGDFVYALSQIDSYIDVSEEDLLLIYDLATQRSQGSHLQPEDIVLGNAYSNGEYGADWAIRHVVDESASTEPEKDRVIYKTVAGKGLRSSGVMTRGDFARWAKYRMIRDEENWKRAPLDDEPS